MCRDFFREFFCNMDVSLFFFTLIGVATSCHHGEEKMKKLFSIPTQLTNNKGPFEADKGYDINIPSSQ